MDNFSDKPRQFVRPSRAENGLALSTLTLESILKRRVTDTSEATRHPPVISISGKPFGRRGDFAIVMGIKKSGKTTVLRFMVATALMNDVAGMDTLGIRSEPANGADVVMIDTEGTEEDSQDFIEGVMRIMDVEEQPANLHVYNFRPYTQAECREATEALLQHHNNAHLVIIDGISDLVKSINDDATGNETVRWLMASAARMGCCIVVAIHENQNNETGDRGRGHLGQELERKASGAIGIRKDRDTQQHFIECRFLRKSEDFDTIAWRFDKEIGRPTSRALTYEEQAAMRNRSKAKTAEVLPIVQRCYLGARRLTRPQLVERLKANQPAGMSTKADSIRKWADRTFDYAESNGLIVRFEGETGDVYELVRGDHGQSAAELPPLVLQATAEPVEF